MFLTPPIARPNVKAYLQSTSLLHGGGWNWVYMMMRRCSSIRVSHNGCSSNSNGS
jgi:hypothetical protein